MSRRVWQPAVNGNPADRTGPIRADLHSHHLRHTHKTWMVEDDIPEIAQARRLPGVRGIYSHVTPATITGITNRIQARRQASRELNDLTKRHLYAVRQHPRTAETPQAPRKGYNTP